MAANSCSLAHEKCRQSCHWLHASLTLTSFMWQMSKEHFSHKYSKLHCGKQLSNSAENMRNVLKTTCKYVLHFYPPSFKKAQNCVRTPPLHTVPSQWLCEADEAWSMLLAQGRTANGAGGSSGFPALHRGIGLDDHGSPFQLYDPITQCSI